MEGSYLIFLLTIVILYLCFTLEASQNVSSTDETEGMCNNSRWLNSSTQNTTRTGSDNNTVLMLKIGFTPDNNNTELQVTINLSTHHVQRFERCICGQCNLACTIKLNEKFEAVDIEDNLGGIIWSDRAHFQCTLKVDQNTIVNETKIRCEKRSSHPAACAANEDACQSFKHLNILCNQSHYTVSWDSSQRLELQYFNSDLINATYCNSGCLPDASDEYKDVTPIIIGVVSGTVALLLVGALCFILCRRRKRAQSIARKYQTNKKSSTSKPDTCWHDNHKKDSGESTGLRNRDSTRDGLSESGKYTSIVFDRPSTASETFSTEIPVPNINNNKARDIDYQFTDVVEPNSFQAGHANNGHLAASSTTDTVYTQVRGSNNEKTAETNLDRPMSTHVYSKLGEKVLHVHDPYNVIEISDDSTHDVADGSTKSTNQNGETSSSTEPNVDNLDSVKPDEPMTRDSGSKPNTTSANSERTFLTKPKAKFHVVDKKTTNHDYFELEKALDSDQENVDDQETGRVVDFNQNDDAQTQQKIKTEGVGQLDQELLQIENTRRVSDV